MPTFATQKLIFRYIFCLKNKAFPCSVPRAILPGCIALLLSLSLAHADEYYETTDLALNIPTEFERLESKAAILALRHKTQGFPTFNAVLIASPWLYSRLSVAEQGQKIADDYRLVGLNNAQLLSATTETLNGVSVLAAKLEYRLNQDKFHSRVWILPGNDRHIIITALFKGDVTAADISAIESLLSGMQFKTIKTMADMPDNSSGNLLMTTLLVIVSACLIYAGYLYMSKKN